jgi:CrcB protein
MELIKTILVVGAGSFLGGAGRYLVSWALRGIKGFPWATLAVNLAGCFLIGLLWGFVGYVAFSVVVGIALVALGYFLVR